MFESKGNIFTETEHKHVLCNNYTNCQNVDISEKNQNILNDNTKNMIQEQDEDESENDYEESSQHKDNFDKFISFLSTASSMNVDHVHLRNQKESSISLNSHNNECFKSTNIPAEVCSHIDRQSMCLENTLSSHTINNSKSFEDLLFQKKRPPTTSMMALDAKQHHVSKNMIAVRKKDQTNFANHKRDIMGLPKFETSNQTPVLDFLAMHPRPTHGMLREQTGGVLCQSWFRSDTNSWTSSLEDIQKLSRENKKQKKKKKVPKKDAKKKKLAQFVSDDDNENNNDDDDVQLNKKSKLIEPTPPIKIDIQITSSTTANPPTTIEISTTPAIQPLFLNFNGSSLEFVQGKQTWKGQVQPLPLFVDAMTLNKNNTSELTKIGNVCGIVQFEKLKVSTNTQSSTSSSLLHNSNNNNIYNNNNNNNLVSDNGITPPSMGAGICLQKRFEHFPSVSKVKQVERDLRKIKKDRMIDEYWELTVDGSKPTLDLQVMQDNEDDEDEEKEKEPSSDGEQEVISDEELISDEEEEEAGEACHDNDEEEEEEEEEERDNDGDEKNNGDAEKDQKFDVISQEPCSLSLLSIDKKDVVEVDQIKEIAFINTNKNNQAQVQKIVSKEDQVNKHKSRIEAFKSQIDTYSKNNLLIKKNSKQINSLKIDIQKEFDCIKSLEN